MIKFTEAEPAKAKEAARKSGDKDAASLAATRAASAAPEPAAGRGRKPAASNRKKSNPA
jgi:hypothetical protein